MKRKFDFGDVYPGYYIVERTTTDDLGVETIRRSVIKIVSASQSAIHSSGPCGRNQLYVVEMGKPDFSRCIENYFKVIDGMVDGIRLVRIDLEELLERASFMFEQTVGTLELKSLW